MSQLTVWRVSRLQLRAGKPKQSKTMSLSWRDRAQYLGAKVARIHSRIQKRRRSTEKESSRSVEVSLAIGRSFSWLLRPWHNPVFCCFWALSYFLALQDSPEFSCLFPAQIPQSVVSPRSPGSWFHWRTVIEWVFLLIDSLS